MNYAVQSTTKWKYHLLFWTVFIAYEVCVSYTFNKHLSNFFDYGAHYLLNISLFYIHAYGTLANSINRRKAGKIIWITGLVMLELTGYLLFKYGILTLLTFLNVPVFRPFVSVQPFIIESGWRAIYFLVLSSGYWIALSAVGQKEKIAVLEKQQLRDELEKQRLENAYMQTQINPHFLFNTLNFVYNTVTKLSTKASQAVLLLSDMMRYALNDQATDGKVELEDELAHIRNFIALAQMRHANALNVEFIQRGEPANVRIIPLALITFVENIFKYADLKNPAFPALIKVSIEGNRLYFEVNNKKRLAHYPHSHGIGVDNVQRRLQAYYPGNYALTIRNREDSYNLHLTIDL